MDDAKVTTKHALFLSLMAQYGLDGILRGDHNKPKLRFTFEQKPEGWNKPCPCGSGKKLKMCCGKK